MANIYQRGAVWWGRLQKDGKELRASLKTRSESAARKALAEWQARLEEEDRGGIPQKTLNEILFAFNAEHLPTLRVNTQRRYGISIQWLNDKLGHYRLMDIGNTHLNDFEVARRAMGASPPTIRRDLSTLSSVYGFAMETGLADKNPVAAYLKQRKRRGLRESPPRTRYLSRRDETHLLKHALPYVRDAMLFAIYSGLRSEEQFSLTWDRVDLERNEVTIPMTIAKSKRERKVVLLDEAVEVLKRTQRHPKSSYVFHHGHAVKAANAKVMELVRPTRAAKDGERFRHLLRGLKETARRAGMKDLRWHDLRRTHGCRLLQEHKWSMEMVRDQLGHQSVTQTEKAYAFLEVDARHAGVVRTNPGTVAHSTKRQKSAQSSHND